MEGLNRNIRCFFCSPAEGGHMKRKDKKGKWNKNQVTSLTVNREYKATIFQMLFHDKKELLSLYNALNGSDYTEESELEIVTLENAVYMSMKNDLAFVLDFHLHLYEHQSTPNPNMPLRDLFYVSQEYQKLVEKKSIYSSAALKIPAPRFIVFYNGRIKQPEEQILKLSDLYELPEKDPMLELQVLMLNINSGCNEELKNNCRTLREYMLYVEKVRFYMDVESFSMQEAVEMAVEQCIQEGILSDFLRKNKAEAIAMSIFEYDEERELKLLREAEYDAGHSEGLNEGLSAGLMEGLAVLVKTLKSYHSDIDSLYNAVVANDVYKDVSKEQVKRLLQ